MHKFLIHLLRIIFEFFLNLLHLRLKFTHAFHRTRARCRQWPKDDFNDYGDNNYSEGIRKAPVMQPDHGKQQDLGKKSPEAAEIHKRIDLISLLYSKFLKCMVFARASIKMKSRNDILFARRQDQVVVHVICTDTESILHLQRVIQVGDINPTCFHAIGQPTVGRFIFIFFGLRHHGGDREELIVRGHPMCVFHIVRERRNRCARKTAHRAVGKITLIPMYRVRPIKQKHPIIHRIGRRDSRVSSCAQ